MAHSRREMESRDNERSSTRESEARAHDIREEYSMDFISPLSLPKGVEKEGYSYYWATTNIRGEAVFDVEKLLTRGWTIVPGDRAPNYSLDPLQRNPYSAKYICTKDMILLERPMIYLERERAAFYKANDNKIKSLRGVRDSYAHGVSGSFTSNRINSF